ncbi:uncharacterized protein LOC141634241 [Silene latifolia]|uniref:uncharacterized protein LOC141634241 n=1 Tax=Silene latifolia TaxID=37657 RepID=UPI003D76D455
MVAVVVVMWVVVVDIQIMDTQNISLNTHGMGWTLGRSLEMDTDENSCTSSMVPENACEIQCSEIKGSRSRKDGRNQQIVSDQYFVTVDNCSRPSVVGASSEENAIKPETTEGEPEFQVIAFSF